MVATKQFTHGKGEDKGTFTVRERVGFDALDKDNLLIIWRTGDLCVSLGLLDTYTATTDGFDGVPDYKLGRILTFINWAQVTTVNGGVLHGLDVHGDIKALAKHYKQWLTLARDPEFYTQWESIYNELNPVEKDTPLPESGENTP